MSELVQESGPQLPPLIVALTTEDEKDALNMVEQTKFMGDSIGYKIPRWFDQSIELRGACKDSGLFTVLDAQLDDGVDEMAISTRRLLRMRRGGEILLPNAITMSPAKETVRGNWKEVSEKIINFAHEETDEPVMVISHIDQTRMRANDPLLHETEIRSINEKGSLRFDAIELHADTVLSESFPRLEGKSYTDPIVLASRVGLHNMDVTPDDVIFNRIGRTYWRGATALYVGNSIMRRAGVERIDYIKKVLDIYRDSRSMPREEFQAAYPDPASTHPKMADVY